MLTSPKTRDRLRAKAYAPLSLAIHLVVACTAAMLVSTAAQAQSNASVQVYNIPAGPLGDALNRFAQQAGVAIAFQPRDVDGATTQGLQGSYSEMDGFDTLLRGSGFSVVKGQNGYLLQATPQPGGALELGATEVSANQLGTITEGTGSYTPGSIATATRMVLTPSRSPS